MNEKKQNVEALFNPNRVEEHSKMDGHYGCVVCGMRYDVEDYADMCCKKIAGIENLGGRRQHRWR